MLLYQYNAIYINTINHVIIIKLIIFFILFISVTWALFFCTNFTINDYTSSDSDFARSYWRWILCNMSQFFNTGLSLIVVVYYCLLLFIMIILSFRTENNNFYSFRQFCNFFFLFNPVISALFLLLVLFWEEIEIIICIVCVFFVIWISLKLDSLGSLVSFYFETHLRKCEWIFYHIYWNDT